jgi:acetyl esterase/lipase
MGTTYLRRVLVLMVFGGMVAVARGQLAPPAKEIALYPGAAPGSESWTWSEHAAGSPANPTIQNVVHPELMYYPADKATAVGTAVIVAPGGGFQNLMMSYEGVDIARQLNAMGVDAFVLKYRLKFTDPHAPRAAPTTQASSGPPATEPSTIVASGPQKGEDIGAMAGADCQQAVRLVRAAAGEYGYRADRVGILGFSAGGRAEMVAIRGAPDGRPDFAAGVYAGGASGVAPPPGAPRLFLAVAADDQSVGYQGSLDMFSAWRKAKVPVELHIFQTGRHGFRVKGGGGDHFMDRLEEWMKVNGYLSK